jgi:hypothetical protein
VAREGAVRTLEVRIFVESLETTGLAPTRISAWTGPSRGPFSGPCSTRALGFFSSLGEAAATRVRSSSYVYSSSSGDEPDEPESCSPPVERRLATDGDGSVDVESYVVRTGVLVIEGLGESKCTGVTGRRATAAFTHFVAWHSAMFLEALASCSSRRSVRFSSSKAAISRFSLLSSACAETNKHPLLLASGRAPTPASPAPTTSPATHFKLSLRAATSFSSLSILSSLSSLSRLTFSS